jgi:hypothetical protein
MIHLKKLLFEIYDTNLLETETSKYKIFCDLDGVLVDFQGGVKKLTGGLDFNVYAELHGKTKMWSLITQQGSIWWVNLPWKSDGKILGKFIKDFDVAILSAGNKNYTGDMVSIGKRQWCIDNLGTRISVIIADNSKEKQYHSQPNYILIDDLESNIQEWKIRGGIGILYKNSNQTIKDLNNILKS